jgi:hypothetical protein
MKCDKCDQEVHPTEDMTIIAANANRCPASVFVSHARHIRCSPSRAQFIVHPDFEPVVDDRSEYDKRLMDETERQELEKKWTAAWRLTRQQFKDQENESSSPSR